MTLATNRTSEQGKHDVDYNKGFVAYDIDWENHIILDKEPVMFKRRIEEAICIKDKDDGLMVNPNKGYPIMNAGTS